MSNSLRENPLLSYDVQSEDATFSAGEQAIKDLNESLESEYNTYLQYKTIFSVLNEYLRQEDCGDSESDKLKSKLHEIILQESLAQTSSLDDGNGEDNLLGVNNINVLCLTYSESRKLEGIVKEKLTEKQCQLANETRSLEKNKSKLLNSEALSEDQQLIENKRNLISLKEEYVKNLLTLIELLTELKEMRLEQLPKTLDTRIKGWTLSEKVCNLKAKLLTSKNRVDVFTETSTSLEAYKELLKDIKEEQHLCEEEIENLNQLKKQYEQVSCKQYDEILKSYLEYKACLERKKLLYSRFKDKA
nr:unnamed protein product [Callosobruchus chinensis]